MRLVKKFEEFDFSRTIPAISVENLTFFYNCDDCNALWKNFNEQSKKCKYCSSDKSKLEADEWYDQVKLRLDEDEIEELELQREEDATNLVDLLTLRKNPNRYVN
mgnify:FL=1